MSVEGLVRDDYGATVEITVQQDDVAVDISSYTTRQVILQPRRGTAKTKTATFKTGGADGVLEFVLEQGDLDEAGNWKLQVRLAKATAELNSTVQEFYVGERL